MTISKLSPIRVEHRRKVEQAVNLRLEGKTFDEIANIMQVSSDKYAWRLVREGMDTMATRITENVDALVERELRELNVIASRYEKIVKNASDYPEVKMKALAGLLKVHERRCTLLGLNRSETTVKHTFVARTESELRDEALRLGLPVDGLGPGPINMLPPQEEQSS